MIKLLILHPVVSASGSEVLRLGNDDMSDGATGGALDGSVLEASLRNVNKRVSKDLTSRQRLETRPKQTVYSDD